MINLLANLLLQLNTNYLGHVIADDEWEDMVSLDWKVLWLWMVQQISQQREEYESPPGQHWGWPAHLQGEKQQLSFRNLQNKAPSENK